MFNKRGEGRIQIQFGIARARILERVSFGIWGERNVRFFENYLSIGGDAFENVERRLERREWSVLRKVMYLTKDHFPPCSL